ncbi:MAG TPA: Holliday junction resolvase RuvX [Patescibacteria group bacterium]|nr:Holliday junction resolvase RuvX [Patescibacteria group bacterium]
MRILGLDVGEKRVGVAVSDESEMLARELEIVPANNAVSRIAVLAVNMGVDEIVVGLPLTMKGTDSEQTKKVREFGKKLEETTDLSVIFFDERMSTAMLKKLPGGSKNKDSLSAQIILQNYLDNNSNTQT